MFVAKLFMQTFQLGSNLSENGKWISFYIHRVSGIRKHELSLPVGSETAGGLRPGTSQVVTAKQLRRFTFVNIYNFELELKLRLTLYS